MPRQIWFVLLAMLVTSFTAFGTTTSTQWQIEGNDAGGSYCYADGGTACTTTVDLAGTETSESSSTALVASDILVTEVTGENTPLNDGLTPEIFSAPGVQGGNLSFVSGGTVSGWTWTGAGELSVTGCVQGVTGSGLNGACEAGDYGTLLVSDAFTSVTVENFGGGIGFVMGGISGTINSQVAAYFGISTAFVAPPSSIGDLVAGLPGTTGNAFSGVTSTLTGGNLNLVTAPEGWSLYSSLGLFAFGLAAFGVARRFGLIKGATF